MKIKPYELRFVPLPPSPFSMDQMRRVHARKMGSRNRRSVAPGRLWLLPGHEGQGPLLSPRQRDQFRWRRQQNRTPLVEHAGSHGVCDFRSDHPSRFDSYRVKIPSHRTGLYFGGKDLPGAKRGTLRTHATRALWTPPQNRRVGVMPYATAMPSASSGLK